MTAQLGSDQETPRRRGPDSIAKNATSSFVAQLTAASLTAILTLFLVRALGPKEYGLFAVTVGMSTIAIAFADFGISNSTARFVAEQRGQQHAVRALIADALKLKLVVTGLVCAILAAFASVVANAYGDPSLTWPLRAMAIATFGQSMLVMLMAVSVALGRAVVNVRLVAIESLLEVSASVALVLAGAGAVGAAFGRAFGFACGSAIAAILVLRMTGHGPVGMWRLPQRAIVRKVGGYASSVFVIDLSYTLSSSLSVLFLGAYAGTAASGTFQAPAKLITLIQFVGLSTASGVAPRLARVRGQEPDVRALQGALRGLIGFQCLMLAPVVVWAGPISRVLLGSAYSGSAAVLTALAPYILFSGIAPLLTNAVDYLGEAKRRVPISLASLALTAACGFILIPRHGAVGAAIAVDIAFGFYTLSNLWLCHRLLQLRMRILAWSLVCGLTGAAAMGIVLASIGTHHLTIVDWITGAAAGLVTYVAMLIFTREIRGAHVARAAAATGALLARLVPAPAPIRASRAAMAPLGAGAVVPTRSAEPEWDEAPEPMSRSAAMVDVPEPAPPGASSPVDPVQSPVDPVQSPVDPVQSPVDPVQSPVELPSHERARRRIRTRIVAGPATLRGVLRRSERRPAVSLPPAFLGARAVASAGSRGRRSPAARPPQWVEEREPQPVAQVEPPASQRSPAARPPEWVEEREPQPVAQVEPPAAQRSPAARPPEWVEEREPQPVAQVEPPAPQRSPAARPPEWAAGIRALPAALGQLDEPRQPPRRTRLRVLADGLIVPLEPSRRSGANGTLPASHGSGLSQGTAHGSPHEREPRGTDRAGNGGRRMLAAGEHPPAWPSAASSSDRSGDAAVAQEPSAPSGPFDAAAEIGDGSPRTDVYQIAWRCEGKTGVFELRPVDLSGGDAARDAHPLEQSPSVPWGWSMPPAPIREARQAHDALVDRLLLAGWHRAGLGDTWFAHCFRSPDRAA